jgi:hypothetical protein
LTVGIDGRQSWSLYGKQIPVVVDAADISVRRKEWKSL